MIEIINEVTEFMNPLQRVNDRTIYFTDIYVSVEKKTIRKNTKGQKFIEYDYRFVELLGKCWELKPKESGKKKFMHEIKHAIDLKKNEIIDITKIILRKELSCSIYIK